MTSKLATILSVTIGTAISIPLAYSQAADNETQGRSYALTIHSNRGDFKVGEEIRIEIDLKNISDKQFLVALEIPTAETTYKAYVRDEKGDLAPETELLRILRTGKDDRGHDRVNVIKTGLLGYLQPGDSIKQEIVLNKLYDLSKPGNYTVEVQKRGGTEDVKSNKITITIQRDSPK